MTRALHALHLLALLAIGLTSCRASESGGSTTPSASSGDVARERILPMPSGALELSRAAATQLTLDGLLTRLSELTGVTFSMAPNTQARLQVAGVVLTQDQRVPAAEVYPWVESLLQQHGYALAVLQNSGAPLVGVYQASDPTAKPPAIRVEASELDECRMHPAVRFSTMLTLPNTDVRALGNSLRILSPDTPTGGVIPVGTTNSVILNGSGRDVAELAALLMSVEVESRQKAERAAASAAAQKP